MRKVRKGFTLVELLIVIAIVGALAAMMTLSGTNATASADASKIVNDLLAVRTAALMFYFDYPDLQSQTKNGESEVAEVKDTNGNVTTPHKDAVPGWTDASKGAEVKFSSVLSKYVDTTLSGTTTTGDFVLRIYASATTTQANNASWYVGYVFPSGTSDTVKERITAQNSRYSLKGATHTAGGTVAELSEEPDDFDDSTDGILYVKVR